mgnify:CR=1 FL=1
MWPFGYVHAYSAGSQKSIQGHFSLFSVDQSHVGGALHKYRSSTGGKNIYVVLFGRMTPAQKNIVRRQAEMNADLFLDLLTWFIQESGHKGYKDVTPPDECPKPVIILQDEDNENNTAHSIDPEVECKIQGKTYYFSSEAQNPTTDNSVFDNTEDFVKAMLDSTAPTLLMYGGSYLKGHEVNLEDAFPIQFPFGTGGPNLGKKRKVEVSTKACLRHYMRLSLNQFMRPDFILVCYHLMCRSASYTTGLIKCRSNFQGQALGERISQLSAGDVYKATKELNKMQESNELLERTSTAASFLKSVTTSCKVLGHTVKAAKKARKKVYALSEFFGPHSIFSQLLQMMNAVFEFECMQIKEKRLLFQKLIAVNQIAFQILN